VIDDVAKRGGFTKEKVRDGIDMLLRNGEAMEPKNGIIQLI
jgi:replicative DNA helicase Mcm